MRRANRLTQGAVAALWARRLRVRGPVACARPGQRMVASPTRRRISSTVAAGVIADVSSHRPTRGGRRPEPRVHQLGREAALVAGLRPSGLPPCDLLGRRRQHHHGDGPRRHQFEHLGEHRPEEVVLEHGRETGLHVGISTRRGEPVAEPQLRERLGVGIGGHLDPSGGDEAAEDVAAHVRRPREPLRQGLPDGRLAGRHDAGDDEQRRSIPSVDPRALAAPQGRALRGGGHHPGPQPLGHRPFIVRRRGGRRFTSMMGAEVQLCASASAIP